jgi:hypothetical protein
MGTPEPIPNVAIATTGQREKSRGKGRMVNESPSEYGCKHHRTSRVCNLAGEFAGVNSLG